MKEDSSKEHMKDVFHILNSIEKVEPRESLFQEIEEKIQREKQNVVPMNWLRIAAVGFICFISVEAYLATNSYTVDDGLSSMVSTVDNTLYDE